MKRIIFIIFLVAAIFIIKNLASSIYTLWHKQDLITQAKRELADEKRKNQELKDRLSVIQSPQFIEEQARNKLFLSKEGEQEVIIPPELLNLSDFKEKPAQKQEPNWKKWWKLFF